VLRARRDLPSRLTRLWRLFSLSVFLLHVVDAVLDGDLGESYAGGRGFAGGKHAGEVQRGVAVLEIELVHGH
jgi:hypothetical protein